MKNGSIEFNDLWENTVITLYAPDTPLFEVEITALLYTLSLYKSKE